MKIEILKIKQGLDSGDECIVCGGTMELGEKEDTLQCSICNRVIRICFTVKRRTPEEAGWRPIVTYKKSGWKTVRAGRFEDEFWAVIYGLSNSFRKGKPITINPIHEVRNKIRKKALKLKEKEAEKLGQQQELSNKLINKESSFGEFGW